MPPRALKTSRGNLRFEKALMDAAPAIWVWEVSTDLFLISNRVREIYGFTNDQRVDLEFFCGATEPHDRSWLEIFDPDAVNTASLPSKIVRYQIQRVDSGEKRWIEARIAREQDRDGLREVLIYIGNIEDITERVQADHALIESEERLRLAVEAGKMAIWEVDLETGIVTNTPELNILFGFPADARPTFEELRSRYAPGERERLAKEGATWEEVRARFARGELLARKDPLAASASDRTQVQAEVSIIVPPNSVKRLLYRAQYAYSLNGRPRITGFLVDITEKKLAEERLEILARELHHRVKNSLAVVHAIASQTFRAQADTESGMQSFLGRLRALSMATDMVLDGGASDADLVDIVASITSPYRTSGADPFIIRGSTVRISGKIATALSMILHELCTNALKYGSLSQSTGQVHLQWEQTDGGQIALDWRERGGPEVVKPTRKGYGTRLIETLVSNELRGTVDWGFDSTGLRFRILTCVLTP